VQITKLFQPIFEFTQRHLNELLVIDSTHGGIRLVESREDIIPRPSHLNLGVRLSPHPASDVLSFRFCSCVYNHGSFRVLLEGFYFSSSYDFHLHGVDVPFHH